MVEMALLKRIIRRSMTTCKSFICSCILAFLSRIEVVPQREDETILTTPYLSGTGDSQRDSRESFAIETPIFIARQADSLEPLELPIRANHATKPPMFATKKTP